MNNSIFGNILLFVDVDSLKTKAILAAEQILKEVKAKNGKIIYPIKPFEYSYLNGFT